MASIATRAVCALLSTVGAAGLVTFANPANSFPAARSHTALAALAAAAPADAARRG